MRQKIRLRLAMAQVTEKIAVELTFKELVEAFGPESAWTITTRQISLAAEAMLQSGLYKPATINRDTSTTGT
jgi:hypothetical protein